MRHGNTVEAVQFIRRMAGHAQAHLLRADDGHHYVVKFRNNPQGPRILINEWITSCLLKASGIVTPPSAVVRVTPEFLRANPTVLLRDGDQQVPVEPGLHFGSRFPGDPDRTSVYDFLPDSLLGQTANLDHFRAMLVYDTWLGNTASRQCVFYRAKAATKLTFKRPARWLASMIDHGQVFNGPHWDFPDRPAHTTYSRSAVYLAVQSLDDFQPWLDQLIQFPEGLIRQASEEIPAESIGLDQDNLKRLLDELCRRRNHISTLLSDCCENTPDLFRSWVPLSSHSASAQAKAPSSMPIVGLPISLLLALPIPIPPLILVTVK